MSNAKFDKTQVAFSCNVLGEKLNKQTEMVIIQVVRKYVTNQNSSGELYKGQSFVDCPRKDDCGIYKQLDNETWDHDWKLCPAKQKFP